MCEQIDLHTSHWHGNVLEYDDHRTDVIQVLPATTKVAYMEPDTAGVWLVHCKYLKFF
jgi:manganese oxidase